MSPLLVTFAVSALVAGGAGWLIGLWVGRRSSPGSDQFNRASFPPRASMVTGSLVAGLRRGRRGDGTRDVLADQILERLAQAVAVIDRERKIVYANNRFLTFFPQATEGSALESVVPDAGDANKLESTARDVLWLGRAAVLDLQLQVGSRVSDLQVELAPIALPPTRERPTTIEGAVIVARDLSDKLRLERMRREFVVNASHELRTPLTSIRGFAETMLEEGEQLDLATTQRLVSNIHRASLRLSHLVDDMLTLAHVEDMQTALTTESVDIGLLITSVCHELEGAATAAHVELIVRVPNDFLVTTHRGGVETIAINLIGNALAHAGGNAKQRKRVWVTVAPEPNQWLLEVRDEGPGIDAAQCERIFERFYRADAGRARLENPTRQGSGLGLSIVKHWSERLRAKAEVNSILGDGTTFTVRFPR